VTGLTPFEAYRSYKTGEKKFNEKRAQLQTTRQNLHLQPSRAHLGEEPLTEEQVKEITAERDRQQFLYGARTSSTNFNVGSSLRNIDICSF